VEDQGIRSARPVGIGQGFPELLLDDRRILGPGDTNPVRHSQDVSIDRQAGHAEGVAQDDVGSLAPDARQPDEVVHGARDLAAVVRNDRRRHADQRPRLGPEESGGLNLRLEFVGRRPRQRARIGVASKESWRDLVDAFVGALRRQNRRDQQFVGVAEMKLGVRVRMLRRQRREDAACIV
jgi:hypothetical protein